MREADRGAPAPTVVQSTKGTLFRLRWDEPVAPDGALPGAGVVDFQHTDAGLVNLSYQSTVPPPAFPILCPSASNCGNSMAGAMDLAIWGSRSPVLAEPLLRRGEWNSVGGTGDDVTSASRYVGRATVRTPAFPAGVAAAKVESTV